MMIKDILTNHVGTGLDLSLHEIDILLSHILTKPKEFLYSHPDHQVTAQQVRRLQRLCERRVHGEPIAYITGHKEFYGLDCIVDKNVLIPRPDTELLVDEVINYCQHKRRDAINRVSTQIADIGTGSGCIAVALKKHLPHATVLATDISKPALQIAKKNAAHHRAAITFFCSDLLRAIPVHYQHQLDIIVSNLPYLTKNEAKKRNLAFEPQVALTPAAAPTDLIQNLLRQSPLYLKPTGAIFLEIGYRQAKQVQKLCQSVFPTANISVHKDLGGFDRLVRCLL